MRKLQGTCVVVTRLATFKSLFKTLVKPFWQYFHKVISDFQHFKKCNLEILLNFYSGHFCCERLIWKDQYHIKLEIQSESFKQIAK